MGFSLFKKCFKSYQKTCVYKIVDKNSPPDCIRMETGTLRRHGINQTWLFLSCFVRGWTFLIFTFSVFCRRKSSGFWLATSARFPFAPLFPVCTFLSEDLYFPAAFLKRIFLMFIFETERASGGGAEREGDTESEADSRL